MPEPTSLEQPPKYTRLPKDILDVVSGKRAVDAAAPVVYERGDITVRRIYNEPVRVSALGPVDFSIDQRTYLSPDEGEYDSVYFNYDVGENHVGTMMYVQMPDETYRLAHRFVKPEFRGKGTGEDLLARSESAFQTIANKDKREISIVAQFGQRNVINWFLKHGYELADDHSKEDWEDLLRNPDNYSFEAVADTGVDDKLGREDGIFRNDTPGRSIEDTVRINLRKILTPSTTKK